MSFPSADLSRARVLGARTGALLALMLGVGATITASAWFNLILSLTIMLVTVPVVIAARPIGARVAAAAMGRGIGRSVAAGVLGALACLLVAAAVTSALGGVWGLMDFRASLDHSDYHIEPDVLRDYVAKPFLVVALYGSPIAIVLGAVHAVLLRALQRR